MVLTLYTLAFVSRNIGGVEHLLPSLNHFHSSEQDSQSFPQMALTVQNKRVCYPNRFNSSRWESLVWYRTVPRKLPLINLFHILYKAKLNLSTRYLDALMGFDNLSPLVDR